MANYTKVFTKPYADGYEDLPSQNTPITAETLNDKDDTLEHIEDYLYNNPIAEVVDNLTTNDATKALSAKQGKILNDTKLNVDDLPTSDIQTSNDGQFTTVTGGLMQSCVVDLEPIQSGSGTPSPSNIRPITGHTQVQVANVGEQNMLDPSNLGHYSRDNTTGEINGTESNYTSTTNVIRVEPSTAYIITRNATEYGCRVFFYDANKNHINNVVDYSTGRFTTPSNCYYIAFQCGFVNGDLTLWQMVKGSTVVPYKPFNGYTTTINLDGTYYGGTLDAVSGVLTVTHGFKDLGTLTYTAQTSISSFYTTLSDAPNGATGTTMNAVCSQYSVVQTKGSVAEMMAQGDAIFAMQNGSQLLFIKDTSKASMSASDFKTAMSGVQLAYKLATPQTIQLTPKALETLVGQNDVFAPLVGQSVEEVEFREVMAIDDVIDAIPYENVAPDVGTGEMFTFFRIHRYGRVVVFTFLQDSVITIVEQATRKIFGVLPERFYTKISGAMPYDTIKYTFINQNRFGVFVPKLLEIDPTNGNVYADYEADEGICPMGSITYILDHD